VGGAAVDLSVRVGPLPCACKNNARQTFLCCASHNKTHGKHFCTIKIFIIAFDILKLSNDFQNLPKFTISYHMLHL
jgi:hypothetical protein